MQRTRPSTHDPLEAGSYAARLRALLGWLVLGAVLAACASGGREAAPLTVQFRSAAVTAEAGALDGAVLSDVVHLEVVGSDPIEAVRFHVDDPGLRGEPVAVAEERPFGLELDTRTLSDGEHVLTVVAAASTGRSSVVTTRFEVANGDGARDGGAAADGSTEDPADGPTEGTGDVPSDAAGGGAADEQGAGEGAAEEAPSGEDAVDSAEPAPATEPAPELEPEAALPGGDLPAATLYVAPDGDDGNDGRSADRPLRSVRAAATRVRPGDVVYLRGGVYPIGVEFHVDGTRDAPIVWASYPGERAIFDGSGEAPIRSVRKFHVRSDWNVFLDLEVRNAPQEGIYVEDAHHNVFRRIVTHGNQFSGIGNVGADGNVYEDIVTYDNFDREEGHTGGDADGIAISSGDGNVIRRVLAFENSDDGIDVWRSTNTRIEHVVTYRNGRGSSGDGNGVKAGSAGVRNGTRVRHVVAFENRRNGFSENGGEDIVFEHSTAFRNGEWDFMGGDGTTRRNNLAPAGSSGMWGAHDERNSWNLGVTPSFVSESFGDDGFLVPRSGSGAEGAGAGGADLGAIPVGGSLRELVGGTVLGLLPR